jgi:hypothetical protein
MKNLSPEILLRLIEDAYRRMATNRDKIYREIQMKKVNDWLEQLSIAYEKGEFIP